MEGSHCKLYDENLVRNIMISTGLSILEYVKEHGDVRASDICDFVELNHEKIIWNTIEDMNNANEPPPESDDSFDDDDDPGSPDEI